MKGMATLTIAACVYGLSMSTLIQETEQLLVEEL